MRETTQVLIVRRGIAVERERLLKLIADTGLDTKTALDELGYPSDFYETYKHVLEADGEPPQ